MPIVGEISLAREGRYARSRIGKGYFHLRKAKKDEKAHARAAQAGFSCSLGLLPSADMQAEVAVREKRVGKPILPPLFSANSLGHREILNHPH